jgi:hypothetical protein
VKALTSNFPLYPNRLGEVGSAVGN